MLKAIETGHFLSSTATLVHKGEKQLVIPQAIQMHPVSDQPMHVDLFRVSRDQKIKVEVQVHFVGEEVSPGLKKGGTLNVVRHTVELLVPAGNIPGRLKLTFPRSKSATTSRSPTSTCRAMRNRPSPTVTSPSRPLLAAQQPQQPPTKKVMRRDGEAAEASEESED